MAADTMTACQPQNVKLASCRQEQRHVAGALHDVVRGGEQRRAAEREDHRVGVQRPQPAVAQPRNAEGEIRPARAVPRSTRRPPCRRCPTPPSSLQTAERRCRCRCTSSRPCASSRWRRSSGRAQYANRRFAGRYVDVRAGSRRKASGRARFAPIDEAAPRAAPSGGSASTRAAGRAPRRSAAARQSGGAARRRRQAIHRQIA